MTENEINWEPQSVADIATALSRIGDNFRSSIAQLFSSFNQLGQGQQWVGKNYNIIANTNIFFLFTIFYTSLILLLPKIWYTKIQD